MILSWWTCIQIQFCFHLSHHIFLRATSTWPPPGVTLPLLRALARRCVDLSECDSTFSDSIYRPFWGPPVRIVAKPSPRGQNSSTFFLCHWDSLTDCHQTGSTEHRSTKKKTRKQTRICNSDVFVLGVGLSNEGFQLISDGYRVAWNVASRIRGRIAPQRGRSTKHNPALRPVRRLSRGSIRSAEPSQGKRKKNKPTKIWPRRSSIAIWALVLVFRVPSGGGAFEIQHTRDHAGKQSGIGSDSCNWSKCGPKRVQSRCLRHVVAAAKHDTFWALFS